MLAPSVLQPRKSQVKHGVRHRKQPRKQEARRQRANRSTAPSPKRKRDRANRQGKPNPLRAPEPPACARAPQRAPGRRPDSGALAEPNSEFPLRRIVILVQPWSKSTILRSLKVKTRDYLHYRKAHTRTTGKNVRFSLPRPRKTVRFDRQRPKQTVFRIAPPHDSPTPCSTSNAPVINLGAHSVKRSRKLAAVSHDACASPPYHNYLAQTLPIPYANLADLFPDPYQNPPYSLHRKILVLPGEIL